MKTLLKLAGVWRPHTARELLQVVFTLCVWCDGVAGFVCLYCGHLDTAFKYMAAAYMTTVVFAVVYAFCALNTPGTVDADSFNGRKARTGRDCLRRLGLFCASLPLVWAAWCLPSLDPVQIGVPLVVLFLTVVGLGQGMRLFCSCVSLPKDEGHK